jgi:CrcB protein
MTNALLVGIGGFLGSVLRYGMSASLHRILPISSYPHGTLAVNVLGCLLIGLLNGYGEMRHVFSTGARLFLFVGLLGGFTTFSTFGYDTLALARHSHNYIALGNILLHLILGLGAVWIGTVAGRAVG